MNESKPNSGWNESKPSFSTGMNVDDAMEASAEFIVDPMLFAETVAVMLAAEVERLRGELAASKDKFVNDCIKHINKVALLNDCEFEGGMIADSIQEYFGDNQ